MRHRQDPRQDRRSFLAGGKGTVRHTDLSVGRAPSAGWKRWLDHESLSQGARWTIQSLWGERQSTEAHPRRSTHLLGRKASGRSGLTLDWHFQVVRHRAARRQGAYRKLHKPRPGQPGEVVCGRVDVQRQHAWWPGTRQHGKQLRSKCGPNSTGRTSRRPSLRNWHSQKSSQLWAAANPSTPSPEVTLLTFAGALDSACHRSASSYIADLRLRHNELDLAISALVRSFKKVIDAVTRGFGPVKKAPKVKLSAISTQDRHDKSWHGRTLT